MDTEAIREAIRARYRAVADDPAGHFRYPVGRESALGLGYPSGLLDRLPPATVDRFVGVGNPLAGGADSGWNVVDVGCGCGLDALAAGLLVGPAGRVVGVDPSPEMLAVARAGAVAAGSTNVEFVEGLAGALPVADGWADLVLSNGALNLATDKPAALAEVARVLRPGGRLRAADLVRVEELPAAMEGDETAWSR